ncbi:MAG: hypothetical protein GY795_28535 [Desulfobacterales bacterium]|nr:hypothetical protein [Desulfobacterales bacterium]
MPILSLIVSTSVVEKAIPVSNSSLSLSLFFTVLSIVSIWSVGLATAIFLWYRDAGLELIAGGSVMFIWIVALA